MELAEAIRIFKAAFEDEKMPLVDMLRINEAAAVLAKQYLADNKNSR